LPDLSAAFSEQSATRNLAAMGIALAVPIPNFHFPTFVGPFSTMDARVSATQSVFDFSSIRRYQASKVNVNAAKSDSDGSAEQVAATVARAYLAAVKADADVETAQSNVTLSEAVLKQAENRKEAGTGTGIEVTRAKVQLANDRQRMLVAGNARRSAVLQLLRAVGLRLDTEIALTDKLQYLPVDAVTLEQARAQAIQARPDLQAQQDREANARLLASGTKLERLPTVAAFGDYGSSGAGLNNSLPTRTVGISVRVPLFDGGRRDARRGESASQYRSEKVRTNDLKEQIELDVRLALDALHSAEEQVKVAKEGLELAENELTQARRRYEAGVAIGVEVTDAQTRLERARDNQTQAIYSHNLGRLDLAQAMGAVRRMVE
jgi:outer membrane protein